MKYIRPFNESMSNADLRLNIESTTINGIEKILTEDPEIPRISESSFIRKATKDDNINGSFIEDGILRIRISGPRDLFGRPGGATYIVLRLPNNFDYDKFKELISEVTHEGGVTRPAAVQKVIEEVKGIIIECTEGLSSDEYRQEEPESDSDHEQTIVDFIDKIKDRIGEEKTKMILAKIIDDMR